MSMQRISRRDFLRGAGVGAVALLGGRFNLFGRSPSQFNSFAPRMNTLNYQMGVEPFVPDVEIALTATEKWVQILPGAQTRVCSYEGQFLGGTGLTSPS